jgi:hypothetical protein
MDQLHELPSSNTVYLVVSSFKKHYHYIILTPQIFTNENVVSKMLRSKHKNNETENVKSYSGHQWSLWPKNSFLLCASKLILWILCDKKTARNVA